MLNKTLSLLAVLLVSSAVLAQTSQRRDSREALGSTAETRGLVTVSDGATVASVVDGQPLFEGQRYVTSSTGEVTLKFRDCEVKLKASEFVVVDERRICAGMIAAIQSVPGAPAAGTFAGFNPLWTAGAVVGAALLANRDRGDISGQ